MRLNGRAEDGAPLSAIVGQRFVVQGLAAGSVKG
jgi:hypothetical protein